MTIDSIDDSFGLYTPDRYKGFEKEYDKVLFMSHYIIYLAVIRRVMIGKATDFINTVNNDNVNELVKGMNADFTEFENMILKLHKDFVQAAKDRNMDFSDPDVQHHLEQLQSHLETVALFRDQLASGDYPGWQDYKKK